MMRMRFGVNYTPSHGWFHFWLDPDWPSVEEDMRRIRNLGMDHVRVFPVWPYLQPNRTWINRKAIADVRRMVHIAGEQGMDAYVDVFQGHLSSFDFLPSWLVTWHRGNMFEDADAVKAEKTLVAELYGELAQEPSFRGLTLGNELNQFSDRPHPAKMATSSRRIDAWLADLLAVVDRRKHVALHSENDGVWYLDHHPFTPVQAANLGDMTTIHSWVFNGTAQGYGAMSEECTAHALYLAELSRAFARNPDRPVWLQEVGAPQNVLEAEQTPEFCRDTIAKAAQCPNLWGVTWWCSHDVDSRMSDFPPFEHALGLFDEHGNIKPIGRAFAEMAEEYRDKPAAGGNDAAVVIEVDENGNPLNRGACGPGGSIFERWMRLHAEGARPTLVTSATARDGEALRRLGVTRLETDDEPHGAKYYTAVSDSSFAELDAR